MAAPARTSAGTVGAQASHHVADAWIVARQGLATLERAMDAAAPERIRESPSTSHGVAPPGLMWAGRILELPLSHG